MHRLLKLSNVSFKPVIPVQLPKLEHPVKCALCNRVLVRKLAPGINNSIGVMRFLSTDISPIYRADKQKNKKLRKRKKKYTELLEVSDNLTSERKTAVKKVGVKNLSLLAEVSASHPLYEVPTAIEVSENICREGNNFNVEEETAKIIEELEEIQEEEHSLGPLSSEERADILQNLTNETIPSTSPIKESKRKNITKANREKMAKTKYSELEKAGKERSLALCLSSYLELCVNCNLLSRGLVTLNYYLYKKNGAIKDAKPFNTILEGYARAGNVDKINEILKIMESQSIQKTVSTFAIHLEGIVRSSKREKAELISEVLKLMEDQGVQVNDMFIQCSWKGDSRDVVMNAVRVVRPSFTPTIPPPDINYSSKLLDHLNNWKTKELVSPVKGIFNIEDLRRLFEEQLKMEQETFIKVPSVEISKEPSENIIHYRDKLDNLKADWERCIFSALSRDLTHMNTTHKNLHKSSKVLNIYPYLVAMDKSEYKDIIMHEIRKLAEGSETFSPTVNQLYRDIGSQVKQRYDMKIKCESGVVKKIANIYQDFSNWYLNPNEGNCINQRQQWQSVLYKHQNGPSIDADNFPWPQTVLHAIGKFLYNIIMRDIKIDINILRSGSVTPHLLPAFYSIFRHQNFITKQEVKPHPVLSRLFRAAALPYLTFNVTELPMVTPPKPWSSLYSGGYIIAKTNLIRLPHQAVQQWDRLNEAPKSQMYPPLDALNQLGAVPWKVNKPILDIVIKVFNDGGCSKLSIPEPPTICPLPEPLTPTMSKIERVQVYRQRMIVRRRKAEMYSLWCDALYRLSLANHFRDKIFWFPHNMDFRGRVYPCPPHLNHLGADMPRSLLVFAKGEQLGKDGLDWLKIHLVNLTGLKKRDSIKDRLAFANEKLDDILDSARNPLDGKKWWMESEQPWQTLACCLEIRDAVENPGGPEAFVSHFPIHQDGSCNGLQHYAALGRDSAGAYSVNLAPSEVPQDVYSCVAAIVERDRANDAQQGVKVAQILEGFVRRKVIKQTVMTTVYGVTRFGARLQIAKQLKDIEDFPKDYVWKASTYLVGKTFASLREMFTSTREIQDWFTESARMIAQVCGQNVEYVTPLGLPVVQPYLRFTKNPEIKKASAGAINEHFSMDLFERPNVMKQKNAFPPNFIHSLDSTHMMLTSLHCELAGITFVSVHDCYWTHPCTAHIMNKICREQFVALHSQPILQDLSDFMVKKYGYSSQSAGGESEVIAGTKERLNTVLQRLPSRGDFDLNNVLNSVYFFS